MYLIVSVNVTHNSKGCFTKKNYRLFIFFVLPIICRMKLHKLPFFGKMPPHETVHSAWVSIAFHSKQIQLPYSANFIEKKSHLYCKQLAASCVQILDIKD